MKKVILLVFILSLPFGLLAFDYTGLGFSIDTAFVQDFLGNRGGVMLHGDLRCKLQGEFEVRIPADLVISKNKYFSDFSIAAVYYPWEKGPFLGMTVFQLGFAFGDFQMEQSFIGMSEIFFGWTFKFKDNFLVEPMFSVSDPSGSYKEEYGMLRGDFPAYKNYRVRLGVGWTLKTRS